MTTLDTRTAAPDIRAAHADAAAPSNSVAAASPAGHTGGNVMSPVLAHATATPAARGTGPTGCTTDRAAGMTDRATGLTDRAAGATDPAAYATDRVSGHEADRTDEGPIAKTPRTRRFLALVRDERGAETAEYAIATMAAVVLLARITP